MVNDTVWLHWQEMPSLVVALFLPQQSSKSKRLSIYSISFCRIFPGRDHNLLIFYGSADMAAATVQQPFHTGPTLVPRRNKKKTIVFPATRRSLLKDYSTIDWLFDGFIRFCQEWSLRGRWGSHIGGGDYAWERTTANNRWRNEIFINQSQSNKSRIRIEFNHF